jgi:regulator of protease activity HflC (stomatin/prohibitin superfamily)
MNLRKEILKMKIKNMIAASLLAMSLVACSKVDPGHVGVKVNNVGSDAGVEKQALGVGYYYNGPGMDIYEYPVYTSTYTWTADENEGSPTNEQFVFQDKNGLGLSADVAVSYHVNPQLAPTLFQKYRMGMPEIVAGPIRTAVRNAIVEEASKMGVEEIYGPRKAELIELALNDVKRIFAPLGLDVEALMWASNIRVPQNVEKQINQKIANSQQALAAEANLATVKANAESRVAEAKGKAESTRIEAEALRANPEIIKQRWIEKWNGQLPTYVGGNAPQLMLSE